MPTIRERAGRFHELLNLKWSDVDLKDGRLLLRVTKNAAPRTTWLHAEAKRLFTAHAKAQRLSIAFQVHQDASPMRRNAYLRVPALLPLTGSPCAHGRLLGRERSSSLIQRTWNPASRKC